MAGKAVLDNAMIERLARNPEAVAQFPYLRIAGERQRSGKCGSCGGGNTRRNAFKHIKAMLAGITPDQAAAIKRLLSVDSLEIITRDRGGKLATKVL